MKYLDSAISLLNLIQQTNETLAHKLNVKKNHINFMFLHVKEQPTRELAMDTFSNDFVAHVLKELHAEAFVITDVATMKVEDKELTYLLYKGYHCNLEKGMVFYQMIDKKTYQPQGKLQFSNMEDNIFYSVEVPEGEESSCNAMETDKKLKDGKSIVFFIGHMDEKRLAHDIQRLIIDTVNNVSKHQKLKFSFIISISKYGGTPSAALKNKVNEIADFTQKHVIPKYSNTHFEFTFENDESLN